MAYPMLEPTSSHVVQYSINVTDRSVHLRLWEPKPATKERLRPFLFAVNYFMETEEEAYLFLQQYLSYAGMDASQLARRQRQGELYIVQPPTESIDFSNLGPQS